MVVSCPFKLINRFIPISFTGCHCVQDPAIEEEPNSPSTLILHKCKVFSTTDSSAIRYTTSLDLECISGDGATKHQNTGPSHGWLDAVVIPHATRKLTCASKSTSRTQLQEGCVWLVLQAWAGVWGSHKDLQGDCWVNGVDIYLLDNADWNYLYIFYLLDMNSYNSSSTYGTSNKSWVKYFQINTHCQ